MEKKIDMLILNAGVVTDQKEYSKYGFEKIMGTNFLGHFFLVENLIDFMIR